MYIRKGECSCRVCMCVSNRRIIMRAFILFLDVHIQYPQFDIKEKTMKVYTSVEKSINRKNKKNEKKKNKEFVRSQVGLDSSDGWGSVVDQLADNYDVVIHIK